MQFQPGHGYMGGSFSGDPADPGHRILRAIDKTLDKNELDTYSKEVRATFAGHDFKILALYGAYEDLEGAPTEGTVILEFPSTEAAKAWYNGEPYRAVREHRFKGANYRVTLVEGIS